MSNKYFIVVLILMKLFLGTEQAWAQNGINDISQIKYLYNGLRFEEAIEFGREYLTKSNELGPKLLDYIHQYMAFSFFNIGETDSAYVHFLSLLTISPEKELNQLETSPKIIDFFNQTKNDFNEISEHKKVISYPEYIFLDDKRPSASWRSAILPGWGQFYKGQPTRGYFFAGAFFSSATILGISFINENKYQERYLNSSDPEEIKKNYDQYNTASKIRRICSISTVGIWLLSFADALWTDYPKIELNITGTLNSNAPLLLFKYYF